jgi:hypothetical protein
MTARTLPLLTQNAYAITEAGSSKEWNHRTLPAVVTENWQSLNRERLMDSFV